MPDQPGARRRRGRHRRRRAVGIDGPPRLAGAHRSRGQRRTWSRVRGARGRARGVGTGHHARVALSDVRISADRILGSPGEAGAALARALEEAITALAVETLGTCQAIFDMTLEYAKVREQFGVPIGSFQAVKHKLANMFVALERARAVCYFAALTIAEDDDRRTLGTSMAKAAVGECQQLVVQD